MTSLPDDSFTSWGWRIPFLFSALLLAIGLYVRLSVVESPVFQEALDTAEEQRANRIPAWEVLRRPRALILATAVGIGPFVLTALISSHVLAYAPSIGYDKADVVRAGLFTSAVGLVCIPLFSALSDRVGRRTVSLVGAIAAIAFAFPMYALVNTGSVLTMTFALMLGIMIQNALYAPLAPMLSEMFGTGVRYTGVSMGYQFASLIGAGFIPMIAAILVREAGGSSTPLSVLMIVGPVVTLLGISQLRESRGRDLTSTITASSSQAFSLRKTLVPHQPPSALSTTAASSPQPTVDVTTSPMNDDRTASTIQRNGMKSEIRFSHAGPSVIGSRMPDSSRIGISSMLRTGAITSSLLVVSARAFDAAAHAPPTSRVMTMPMITPTTEPRIPIA